MTAMPAVERMTAEEYSRTTTRRAAARSWSPACSSCMSATPHAFVAAEIDVRAAAVVRAEAGRGRVTSPIDVRIGDHDVYAPDLLWYRADRAPRARCALAVPGSGPRRRGPLAEHLALRRRAKKPGYERAGLPELWLVDTAADVRARLPPLAARRARASTSRSSSTRSEALTSPLLPGFALPLATVFGE